LARSRNSSFGKVAEYDVEVRTTSPEQGLLAAILRRAINDLIHGRDSLLGLRNEETYFDLSNAKTAQEWMNTVYEYEPDDALTIEFCLDTLNISRECLDKYLDSEGLKNLVFNPRKRWALRKEQKEASLKMFP